MFVKIQNMKIKVSENLLELANILKPLGTLYIIGGYVRNSLLGIVTSDLDICASITPEKLIAKLKDTKYKIEKKNLAFGTVAISCEDEIYQYTTFRKDNYASTGEHRPKSVAYIEDIRQDAQRRDFTINSIYYDILQEKIIDVYSGKFDLRNQIIRTVEVPAYVFAHDGLRILRMIRFACELNFKIDNTTLLAAKKLGSKVNDISNDRKYYELMRILNSPTKYSTSKKNAHIKGLNYFNDLKLWPSYNITTTKVKVKMSKKVSQENVFIGLLIDIIDTICPDCIEYYLKDILGSNGFNLPASQINELNLIICGYYDALNKMDNKKYFFKYFDYFDKIAEILQIKSNSLYSKYKFFHSYIKKHKLPVSLRELKINGDILKKNFPALSPKKYGYVLNELLSKVFDAEVQNTENSLIKEAENVISNCGY